MISDRSEELGRATVRVTTLGDEFVRGAEGMCVVDAFPTADETVTLEWQQSRQNFGIIDVAGWLRAERYSGAVKDQAPGGVLSLNASSHVRR